MQVKLLSGALGAEIGGINLKDTSSKNFELINNLLLEHKVLFLRNQHITFEEQIALAKCFGPLERHVYVKGRDKYPEIVRTTKGANEKHQWGETWHTDVSYNVKPTKVIVLKSIKIPPVGGDTMFSNMELAWDTLGRGLGYERIMDRIAIEGDRPN
jgi:taurine dioxygenase